MNRVSVTTPRPEGRGFSDHGMRYPATVEG